MVLRVPARPRVDRSARVRVQVRCPPPVQAERRTRLVLHGTQGEAQPARSARVRVVSIFTNRIRPEKVLRPRMRIGAQALRGARKAARSQAPEAAAASPLSGLQPPDREPSPQVRRLPGCRASALSREEALRQEVQTAAAHAERLQPVWRQRATRPDRKESVPVRQVRLPNPTRLGQETQEQATHGATRRRLHAARHRQPRRMEVRAVSPQGGRSTVVARRLGSDHRPHPAHLRGWARRTRQRSTGPSILQSVQRESSEERSAPARRMRASFP